MRLLIAFGLFGVALSEVFFDEKFDDGEAWESR